MATIKRGNTWWVRFQWRGQEIRRSAKTSVRRVAQEYERELRAEFGRIDRGGKPRQTFDRLMVDFAEQHLPTLKPGSACRYRVSGKVLLRMFRGKYIDEINKTTLAEFVRRRRREGVTDSTIRRDLACLSSALTCAVHWDWIDQNVVKAMDKRRIREAPSRVRWLRQSEYDALIAAATSPRQVTMITLLVETGMRLGELLGIERERDINIERREIYLSNTKTNAPRVVPLSDKALAQISAHPQRVHCPYLFSTKDGKQIAVTAASAELSRTIKRAKIQDFRPHDFRHTFASWYLQNGGRIERLQQILGHKRLEQTMIYAHLATQDLHDDLQRVGTNVGTTRTESEQPGA